MKNFQFSLAGYEIDWAFSPIRSRIDILSILMKSVLSMLRRGPESVVGDSPKLVLHIGNMSRLFFVSDKKIYSITFPFSAVLSEDSLRLSFSSSSFGEIDSQVAHGVLDIAEALMDKGILDIGVLHDEIALEFQDLWTLFRELLVVDDGYVRFDHDPERANEKFHPLFHIDVFFSNRASVKVGLNSSIDVDGLMDILDKETECHYLGKRTSRPR